MENIALLSYWYKAYEIEASSSPPPTYFWIVLSIVILGLVVYCIIVCLSAKWNDMCHKDAYFGSSKLSMVATHGAILVF